MYALRVNLTIFSTTELFIPLDTAVPYKYINYDLIVALLIKKMGNNITNRRLKKHDCILMLWNTIHSSKKKTLARQMLTIYSILQNVVYNMVLISQSCCKKKSKNQRQFKSIHSTSYDWENGGVIKRKREIGVRSWFGGDGELIF